MRAEERIDDIQEAIALAIEGKLAGLWTALPAIIQSVDYIKQTLTAQPTITAKISDFKQKPTEARLPMLLDVPFFCLGGADFVITMPNLQGAECLIVFASRCIDRWWAYGGIQSQAEQRMHDLSDGFALVGFNSQPKKINNYNTSAVEIRNRGGDTKITIAHNTITLTASNVNIIGAVDIVGAVTTSSTIIASGEVTGSGKHLSTHVHGGVQTGSSNTGGPI